MVKLKNILTAKQNFTHPALGVDHYLCKGGIKIWLSQTSYHAPIYLIQYIGFYVFGLVFLTGQINSLLFKNIFF